MGAAKLAEDRRLMVLEDAYSMWAERRLMQEQPAELLGVRARTFRRWTDAPTRCRRWSAVRRTSLRTG